MMTEEEIKKARELCAKATPGEWSVNKYGGIGAGEFGHEVIVLESEACESANPDDIYFIVYAKKDMCAALDTIVEQRKRIAALLAAEQKFSEVRPIEGRMGDKARQAAEVSFSIRLAELEECLQ